MSRSMTRMWRSSTSRVTRVPASGSAEADVVQPAVVAQGDGAGLVDAVVADSAVRVDVGAGGGGLGSGGVGLARGSGGRAPGAGGRCCSSGGTGRAGAAARRWSWPVAGRRATSSGSAGTARPCRRSAGGRAREWSNRTPSRPSSISRATRPPRRGRPVKTAPLSVSTLAGIPQRRKASWKAWTTSGPVMVRRARLARASREWSSRMLRISTVGAVGELPVGGVGLPAFVGLLGFEPVPGRPGSLLRLRGDEAAAGQDPPDRRDRRAGLVTSRSATSGCDGQPVGPGGCGWCPRRRPVPAGTAPCGAGRSGPRPRPGPRAGWGAGVCERGSNAASPSAW